MNNKYQTKMVAATALRAGVVMYHGGEVATVTREGSKIAASVRDGRTFTYTVGERVRVYPNL